LLGVEYLAKELECEFMFEDMSSDFGKVPENRPSHGVRRAERTHWLRSRSQRFRVLATCALLIGSLTALWSAPGVQGTNHSKLGSETFDLDRSAIPKLVEADYIELSKIASISKFRSAEGHDYSDDFESCRSMKHYFKPSPEVDWSRVRIFSPVAGAILRTEEEQRAGTKVEIQAQQCAAVVFIIHHVRLCAPLRRGDRVVAGQTLGVHIGKETYSDIAVAINTPKGRKLVSYFEVMPDSVFRHYQARGLTSRAASIISKESRDADSLSCLSGSFTSRGHIPSWITLNPGPPAGSVPHS
jgi:hypothetical protein